MGKTSNKNGLLEQNCESCRKSFSRAQTLKKHIHIVHEGHKDHKCEFCGKSFSQVGHLRIHIKRIHEGNKDSLH